jgi:predicted DCC family thiol-disulfide oxidoreductase YuxK
LTIKLSAFCVSCNKNVEGRLTEMVVLDSGNWLYRGECPECCYEIKRIIPKDNSGSYNGRRAVSETDNEGPIPSPEADE